jgi:AcrR family transcriptional regulator
MAVNPAPRATRTRRRREPLTRDRVLATALAIADADGLEALTMRRLAQELGVEAMSLYHHVEDKRDLLGGIAELVVRQIELPSRDGDWKVAIRACAISAHAVLRAHPWAPNLLMSSDAMVPSRLQMIDAILDRLTDAHLPDETLDLAYHALDSHILGFTLWEAGYSKGLSSLPEEGGLEAVAAAIGLRDYPHLFEHAAWHFAGGRGAKPAYEFGLDLILDGIEPGSPAAAG